MEWFQLDTGCLLPAGPELHLLLQVTVPQHRLTPLKNSWMSLYTPVTENMKLDMRMNLKAKKVVSLLDRNAHNGRSENLIGLREWHTCYP